jgi:SP family galactose:H+ symporter-like MFS transporter
VFSARWRRPLLIGVGLAIAQQITGINAIIYYANRIFAAAGFTSIHSQAQATTWAIGAVNVLATLIAVRWVDRLGRKPLLLAGLTGMFVSLTLVGFAFHSLASHSKGQAGGSAGTLTVIGLVVYIASFGFSLGPVVWTMINEIYPREVRGRMVSVATAINWLTAYVVSQNFLSLTDALGEAKTFWLFALTCVIVFGWILRFVPETKGRTLEQIEQMWTDPGGRK